MPSTRIPFLYSIWSSPFQFGFIRISDVLDLLLLLLFKVRIKSVLWSYREISTFYK